MIMRTSEWAAAREAYISLNAFTRSRPWKLLSLAASMRMEMGMRMRMGMGMRMRMRMRITLLNINVQIGNLYSEKPYHSDIRGHRWADHKYLTLLPKVPTYARNVR